MVFVAILFGGLKTLWDRFCLAGFCCARDIPMATNLQPSMRVMASVLLPSESCQIAKQHCMQNVVCLGL